MDNILDKREKKKSKQAEERMKKFNEQDIKNGNHVADDFKEIAKFYKKW
ncbi:MAG: hypothetical protein OXI87_18920 [Albidovulum sp.]|nr:hypothetical protein [Albidovulum sp.]